MSLLFEADIHRSAEISPCGAYRYALGRSWGATPPVNFIMLNPSTADAEADDPTIRRCIGFARSWGYGSLVVTNLFAWRATDPRELRAAPDPIGPENDRRITEVARASDLVVCAWGNHGVLGGRAPEVLYDLRKAGVTPRRLRLSGSGQPCHPLYLPAALRPVPMEAH